MYQSLLLAPWCSFTILRLPNHYLRWCVSLIWALRNFSQLRYFCWYLSLKTVFVDFSFRIWHDPDAYPAWCINPYLCSSCRCQVSLLPLYDCFSHVVLFKHSSGIFCGFSDIADFSSGCNSTPRFATVLLLPAISYPRIISFLSLCHFKKNWDSSACPRASLSKYWPTEAIQSLEDKNSI